MSSQAYARPITLMRPERLTSPPPWVGHIPFAFWIVDVMRPRRFVELGTHSGNSFCAFLQAADALSVAGEYFAVDHWHGDEQAGLYGEDVFNDLRRYVDTRYGLPSALLRMTFDQALTRFEDASIDLLHMDGLHTYEAVRHDFDSWLPKMSKRGVMLFHDTAVRERDFGVYRLFTELAQRYPSFEFFHSHGLGVVQTGTEGVPELLSALLRNENDISGLTPRSYFERLGNALIDEYYLQSFMEWVQRKENVEVELAHIQRRQRELQIHLEQLWDVRSIVEGYESQAQPGSDAKAIRLILGSGLFDPNGYAERAGIAPGNAEASANHYLTIGEAAGLAPSVHFDPQFYREQYPDIAMSGTKPLLHYLCYGRLEGRSPRSHDILPDIERPAPIAGQPTGKGEGTA
ncbi:class I SAM-dependent methyltransferase [Nitratireductor thuwali]|uniref:Class I SAM-dependent methyltransferase n=1 Tax=Nitratireductor thuwali TaxID=2267699 RepID=A0ABY5MJT0_9HYPH|nr:hypothetical protein NTH_02720 [Nitratireductor thuwali]